MVSSKRDPPMTRRAVRRWLQDHRLNQNKLAIALGRDPSLVSKVIRGTVKTSLVWGEITAFMKNPARYRRRSIRSRRRTEEIERARAVLRANGILR